jgi:hypothetical protein
MSKAVHRVVMARLLHISAKAEAFRLGTCASNFRNFHVNQVEVVFGDPTRFQMPRSGRIQFDFLECSPFVLTPCASPKKWLVLADSLKGLQLATEAHIQSLTFLLKAFAKLRDTQQAEAWEKQKAAVVSTMKGKGKRKENKKGKAGVKVAGKLEAQVWHPAARI